MNVEVVRMVKVRNVVANDDHVIVLHRTIVFRRLVQVDPNA